MQPDTVFVQMLAVALALPLPGAPSAPRSGAAARQAAEEAAPRAIGDYASDVAAILTEATTRGRAHVLLEELCARAPHRLAGSKGAEAAVEWARAALEREGLESVRLEPCTVPRWERGGTATLAVTAPADAAATPLPILALGGSVGTPEGGIEAELVSVRSFEELRGLGERARGRIVLFDRPMDPARPDPFAAYGDAVDQRSRGAIEAARAGAVAALVRSMTTRLDDHPHTGAMRYDEDLDRVPAAAISTLGAGRLAELSARGPVRLRLALDCRTHPDVESANVIGEIPGRERPDEVVLIGAHLDAWDVGQGAHDDGAGCAQVIEAARLLRASGLRPRRTLRVVLFMNEENGLRGARAYRDRHREELAKHVLALESDRGGFTPRGFTSDAIGAQRDVLVEIAALLAPIGADRVVPGGGGADVGALEDAGVPLVGYYPDPQRYFDVHHSALDVVESVHPRELELGAVAIAALAYVAADLAEPLPRSTGTR